jgi:hypothetical protein
MKKFAIAAVALCIGCLTNVNAQSKGSEYETAIGVKLWDGGGVSLKHFTKPNTALEGILYFWGNGVRITGLYELHYPLAGVDGLQWYVGPGAHIGIYNSKGGDGAFIGIDGVIGLDYKIHNAPLNFSLDWNPNIEFGSGRGFNGGWGGLAIRYTLR